MKVHQNRQNQKLNTILSMAFVYLDDVRVPMLVFNVDGDNVVILSDVARHLGFSVSGNDGVFVIEMD